jgi:hypothetical protein
MTPWGILARVAGMALITAGGVMYLSKKTIPKTDDMMEGAIYFKKGMTEFQKGFETMFFGGSKPTPEEAKKKREAARIEIE